MHEGLRYNNNKLRYDLLPTKAIEGMAKVMTYGAEKYAPRNWENGMAWTSVLASMKRHVAAFERGEDFDSETGLLHIDHVMCNAAFISEYYKIYPQGDDRTFRTINNRKIGVDIDDVLANFVDYYCDKFNMQIPSVWHFDPLMDERLSSLGQDFWLYMPVKNAPDMMSFEPHVYITSRRYANIETTIKWLIANGYPNKDVVYTISPKEKADIARDYGVDIFIDDSYDNYLAMHSDGTFCYLYNAKHNERYNVGHRRINSLIF